MESHLVGLKTEKKEVLLSQWEHSLWNEFTGPGKLKIEPLPTMSLPEQINITTCFSSPDNNFNDKARPIREFYKCDQCDETATSMKMLRQHRDSIHNNRKTYRCTVSTCTRAFTSANYLKNHVDIEHTDCSEASIPCPKKDCGLFFPNNYRLKRHIRHDHKQEKLYQCPICARKFASLEVRNNHVNIKHVNVPLRDNFAMKLLDANYYRTEQNKESENDTVYAASPISSRLESANGQSSIDTTCEAQWLTKSSDSNLVLSKQIDRILFDIFSDKYQETLHKSLSSSELAIAIVSLEEANDVSKRKQPKSAPHLNPFISTGLNPLSSIYQFNELDIKMSTINSRLTSAQYNIQNGGCHPSLKNIPVAQTYPQSNTESEGHSTESQRSFLVNSSQHDEFSDISMESHLKDVFSSTVDKWNSCGNIASFVDNPLKLVDYTCLDTMFDDFHDIIANDSINTHNYLNGQSPLVNHQPNIPGQKNHLLSLNNMHSKFLGGPQLNHQTSRSNAVPSNQMTILSNYEVNRRKMSNCFSSSKINPAPYDIAPPYPMDPIIRDSSFPMDVSTRCHMNPSMKGSICPPDGRMRMNYPYGSNQQLMSNGVMYYNREPAAMYIQQSDRSSYPVGFNCGPISNKLYHNSMENEFISDPGSQYSNIFRRRVPPPYQGTAAFNHQMLPSQQSTGAPPPQPLAHCPPSMHRNSCFYPQHSNSSRGLYEESSVSSIQQRHLLTNAPIAVESQGQQCSSNHPAAAAAAVAAAAAINDKSFSECEDSIVSEEQSSSVISNEQSNISAINCAS